MNTLDDRLLAAHERGDTRRLAALYEEAAETATDDEAAAFYLTHAYVFALDAGLKEADALRQRLVDMGRETPLQDVTTIER